MTETEPESVEEPTAAPEEQEPVEVTEGVFVEISAANYDAETATIKVRSSVSGHIGAGTCTFTATSAEGEVLTATAEGMENAQNTVCPATELEGVTEGEWSVVVTYEDGDVAAVSEALVVEATA